MREDRQFVYVCVCVHVHVYICIHVHKLRVLPRMAENTSLHSDERSDQNTMAKLELKVWNFQVALILSHGKDGTGASPSVEPWLPLECRILSPAERPAGF